MKTIYTTNAILALIVAAAVFLPRFTTRGEGLAAAAGAVLVFLALLLVATIVAIWLAVWTWRRRDTLPTAGLWLGLAPAALGVTGFTTLLLYLRY